MLSRLRRADDDFNLITDGARVAVGLSGGKDSITLLQLLSAYRRFSPHKYELCAITIDTGAGADFTPLSELCKELSVEYFIEKTQIKEIVFDVRKESSPCSLCAKMRRGALCSVMNDRRYDTLALGHHADDFVNTFLLSLLYEGRLHSMQPRSLLTNTKVAVIRPMLYIFERDIKAHTKNFTIVKNPCPVDRQTKRAYCNDLVEKIGHDVPNALERIHTALMTALKNDKI